MEEKKVEGKDTCQVSHKDQREEEGMTSSSWGLFVQVSYESLLTLRGGLRGPLGIGIVSWLGLREDMWSWDQVLWGHIALKNRTCVGEDKYE